MKYIYYLQAGARHKIRDNLKKLNKHLKAYSSTYLFDQQYYVLVETKYALQESVLQTCQLNYIQHNTIPRSPQQLVINWGIAELEQNINYINYENQAKTVTNGCYLTFTDFTEHKIIRSFQPLSETMYIVNNTPDSFSEQGQYYQHIDKILTAVIYNLELGASIIDLGAESTRPNAEHIDTAQEIQRLELLIKEINKLKSNFDFQLSLDSYKAPTIKYFLDEIDIINDVSGNLNPDLLSAIAKNHKTYIAMHSLTVPANPQITLDLNINPVNSLLDWGKKKLTQLEELGFKPAQIILDIGIGFNKTPAQSWFLLKHFSQFQQLDCQLLIGHSRKSFFNFISSKEACMRDLETAVSANYLACQLVDYLRLHNLEAFYRVTNTTNQLNKNLAYRSSNDD